jgi:amino acid transporter
MLATTVFNFTNIFKGFYSMGYGSILWYGLATLGFGIPFSFMIAELASAFKDAKGGIYSWLEHLLGRRLAFIAIFMWYAGFVTFLVNMASSALWINLSTMLFGIDKTSDLHFGKLAYNQVLGILAIVWLFGSSAIASLGLKSVALFSRLGGLAISLLLIILLIGSLLLLIATPSTPVSSLLTTPSVTESTSFLNQGFFVQVSFLIYAIFAFGGMETASGLVNKMQQPEKKLPKALILSTLAIASSYIFGILAVGVFSQWQSLAGSSSVNLGNVSIVVMRELGYQLALTFGGTPDVSLIVAQWFGRVTGIGLFFSMLGAFFVVLYAPLGQLISGTPATLWPNWLLKRKNDLPITAMYGQAALASVLVLLNSFFGQSAKEFLRFLTEATNIAVTIPYAFIAIGYWFFIRNTAIVKPFVILKNRHIASSASLLVASTIVVSTLFGIAKPILQVWQDPQNHDINQALWRSFGYLVGPLLFVLMASLLFNRASKPL